jgi:dihydroorotase-like cyclic amidohydrolase
VKEPADRERLWRGLSERELSFVTTDHAAGEWPREKNTGSFWSDYGGIPGVELLLPWLLTAGVRDGRITLERLTELLCAGPARFFGVSRRKGALEAGLDADFVVLREGAWTVRAQGLHCLNRYTPFEGLELGIRVRQTWSRGALVFDGEAGAFPAGPGHGRFIPREDRDV